MEYPTNIHEAKATGAKYYFTGKPCKYGHIALRKTKGTCVGCLKTEWQASNAARALLPKSEASKEAGKRYYERNKKLVIARAQARPSEAKRLYKTRYKEANPELYKLLTSLRRRRHKNATPKWLSTDQKKNIRNLYLHAMSLSKVTGERYAVDHIIPLNGEDVCGLHVPWNLRVITQEENLAKSNKV